MKKFASLCALVGALATVPIVTSLESCGRKEKTLDIISPDYILENYRWFKNQSAAIDQVDSQIKSIDQEIIDYREDFKPTPVADWPYDARDELARKESVRRGYISQYNMLVKDFNARSSDITKRFTKGNDARELRQYLGKTYQIR